MKIDEAKQLIIDKISETGIVAGSLTYTTLYKEIYGKDISRQTIKNALNELEAEGHIVKTGYPTPYWRKS